jgi:hypothetical protein
MIDEYANNDGASRQSNRSPVGKIARLPNHIREQMTVEPFSLSQRERDGVRENHSDENSLCLFISVARAGKGRQGFSM